MEDGNDGGIKLGTAHGVEDGVGGAIEVAARALEQDTRRVPARSADRRRFYPPKFRFEVFGTHVEFRPAGFAVRPVAVRRETLHGVRVVGVRGWEVTEKSRRSKTDHSSVCVAYSSYARFFNRWYSGFESISHLYSNPGGASPIHSMNASVLSQEKRS